MPRPAQQRPPDILDKMCRSTFHLHESTPGFEFRPLIPSPCSCLPRSLRRPSAAIAEAGVYPSVGCKLRRVETTRGILPEFIAKSWVGVLRPVPIQTFVFCDPSGLTGYPEARETTAQSSDRRQFTRNPVKYRAATLRLQTEAVVHVPERIMRKIASWIAHECFRLNKRYWGEIKVADSLAENLVIGHAARIKGKIDPFSIHPNTLTATLPLVCVA